MFAVVRVALLAMLLGGCAMLHSPEPLVGATAPDARLPHGRYAAYAPFTEAELAALDASKRSRCVDPGYRLPEPQRLCPFDSETGKPSEPVHIGPQGDGDIVRWKDRDDGAQQVAIRLRRIAPDLDLIQFTGLPDQAATDREAYYALLRRRGAAIELLWVPCGDEPGALPCEVRSIDAIAPRLIAYGKDLNNAPAAMFNWLGD